MQNTVSEPVKEPEKTGGMSDRKSLFNMLVVGPPDAGKTYFLNEVFDQKILKATDETVGVVDFGKRELDEEIDLQIHEAGGKQNIEEIDPQILNKIDIALVMINDDSSYNQTAEDCLVNICLHCKQSVKLLVIRHNKENEPTESNLSNASQFHGKIFY